MTTELVSNDQTGKGRLGPDDAGLEVGLIHHDVATSLRSRILLTLMRFAFRPIVGRLFKAEGQRMLKLQLRVAAMGRPEAAGLGIDYRLVGREPGHVIGTLDQGRPVVLWLHGGAFVVPAAMGHLLFVARLCSDLDAAGFMPDYRLSPQNPFPAGLDDCERAYRALLEQGFSPDRIVLGGDSAGGNLALGLLQRIRKAGLPMPVCVVPVSPVTEMGRGHGPSSRHRLMKRDPLLPILALTGLLETYIGEWDSSDPEISPLYMDCDGLPPAFFLASANEILMDDSVLMSQRMREAGVNAECHIWPHFPHAFPLFESLFPEVAPARQMIVDFVNSHIR